MQLPGHVTTPSVVPRDAVRISGRDRLQQVFTQQIATIVWFAEPLQPAVAHVDRLNLCEQFLTDGGRPRSASRGWAVLRSRTDGRRESRRRGIAMGRADARRGTGRHGGMLMGRRLPRDDKPNRAEEHDHGYYARPKRSVTRHTATSLDQPQTILRKWCARKSKHRVG